MWGSTYLAIRIAVDTLPPFLLAGARFLVAGLLLLAWTRFSGRIMPTRRQWLGAFAVGACLVLLSNAPIVIAERSIPSGMVALFAAGTPLLITLLDQRRTHSTFGPKRILGLALGTIGMIVLASATFQVTARPTALLLMVLASLSWAVGSTWGRDWWHATDHLVASAAQMIGGGLVALVASMVVGEPQHLDIARVTTASLLAWGYLCVFGSLIAFPVYQWLLRQADATSVSSYTYINPIVAVALGVAFLGEPLTVRTLIATALLLPAVGLLVRAVPAPEG